MVDTFDLDCLEEVDPSFDTWSGRLCGLAPFDAARDATHPQLHDLTTNLLLSPPFPFRLRLEDGPDGVRIHSRQCAVILGIRIKTFLPVSRDAWPKLMVCIAVMHYL